MASAPCSLPPAEKSLALLARVGRRLFGRPTGAVRPPFRPLLEGLEGRVQLATLTVTTSADDGAGSLRRALADAASGDTIRFAPGGLAGGQTIALTSTLLIDRDLSVDGTGAPAVTVSGGGAGSGFSVFMVDGAGTASMTGLTITGGGANFGAGIFCSDSVLTVAGCILSGNSAGTDGGGIYAVDSMVTVTGSTLSDNTAGNGGGIYATSAFSTSALTVTGSTLNRNSAVGGGGGIYVADTTATVVNSTLSDNTTRSDGGGIYATSVFSTSTLTVTGSTLSRNSAARGGGGIYIADTTATVINSTLSDNTADSNGGGILSAGLFDVSVLTVAGSTLSRNSATQGGGIYANFSIVTVTDSTLSDNTAEGDGGGVCVVGLLTVNRSTLSGNRADRDGGGLCNADGASAVVNSTLSGNSAGGNGGGINVRIGTVTATGSTLNGNSAAFGGGILGDSGSIVVVTSGTLSGNSATGNGGGIRSSGATTLVNTVVAGSLSGGDLINVGGTFSGHHNLIGDGSELGSFTASTSGAPLLSPLGGYGGPTRTVALLPGSPALGTGGAVAALATGVTAAATTVTVDTPLAFAAGDLPALASGWYFVIRVGNELMAVVGKTGNTLAVARGFQSTAAAAHAGGAGVTLASDQRGRVRAAGAPDIGAFQSQGFTVVTGGGGGQHTTIGSAFAAPLVVTVTANDPLEPVDGGVIRFAGPGSGASIAPVAATIAADGTTAATVTANRAAGGYNVTASAAGVTNTATFALTNDKAVLTVSGLTVSNKVYDGTTAATVTSFGTLIGVVPGDGVALNTGGASAAFATADVGTGITVIVSGLALSGAGAANYTLVLPAVTANITAAPPDGPTGTPTRPPVLVGGLGVVQVTDPATGLVRALTPFVGFAGEVRVAVGDVTGDGVPDVVVGAGPGAGPHVKVFDSATLQEVRSFYAFDPAFRGGVSVAAGDVTGDGTADLVVGSGFGASHVKVFDGATGAEVRSFLAFPGFAGGVTVAAGDLDGDGIADLLVGAGPGAAPHVKAFGGRTGEVLLSLFAFDPAFTGGVNVGGGDLDGNGRAEVVVGAGPGAAPEVRVFDAAGALLGGFGAFDSGFRGGVRVGVADGNGDAVADVLVGAGPGAGPHVRAFAWPALAVVESRLAFDPAATGGVYVA